MWLYSTSTSTAGGFVPGNYTTFHVYPDGSVVATNPPNGYTATALDGLESGQSFLVQSASPGATSVSFAESNKTTGTPLNIAYFGNPVVPKQISVGLQSTDSVELDEIVIGFKQGATDAYNPDYDAESLDGGNQVLVALKGGYRLAIATLPDSTAADSAKLGVKSTSTGTFQLAFSQFGGMDSTKSITLVDKYLDSTMDIRASRYYVFNVTGDSGSFGNNRFEILFGATANPLPVNFTNISATKNEDGVAVKWSVANELNIASYTVERSENGASFSDIATAKATGATAYTSEDEQLPTGASTLYYRIKSIGNDGSYKYSPIAKLTTYDLRLTTLSIYPNPVQGKLNIILGSATNGT
jgi:hypothetical protein